MSDYLIQLPTKVRLFHANLLKNYHEREEPQETTQITVAAKLEPDEEDKDTLSVQLLSDARDLEKCHD